MAPEPIDDAPAESPPARPKKKARKKRDPSLPKLTCEEAGRIGGLKTAKKFPKSHFKNIGRKGGNHTAMWHGTEGHYSKIGKLGGAVIAAKVKTGSSLPTEHYRKIGKKGGKIVREAFKELRAFRAAAAEAEAKAKDDAAQTGETA